MPPTHVPRPHAAVVPDRLYMELPVSEAEARAIATSAVNAAARIAPKLTGLSAARLTPLYGDGFIGIAWADDYVWYQETGTNPYTMRSLAGKTIPMWIDDPTGEEQRKNPRARVRRTASGKVQVLIFRRAAKLGQRRFVRQRNGAIADVPASYPGAPGRIALREARLPYTTVGKTGGRIAARNVGVRWRHPGLTPRAFLLRGLTTAARQAGLAPGVVHVALGSFTGDRSRTALVRGGV